MTFPVVHYPLATVAIVSLLILAACNPKPQPDFVFDTRDLSQKEVRRAEAECHLEAEKAAMRAKYSLTAGENRRKILILCMGAKGARYRGTTDEFPNVKRKPV